MASVPCTCCPVARHTTFDPQVFLRLLLLRRLWIPLPSSSRVCLCGRPLDSSGHHPRQHVLWRGFSGVVGLQLSRQRLECAEKREGGCPPTSASRTWTSWPQTFSTNAEWRSWLTGCLCSTGSSWRSTQHWCLRWSAMDFHALVAHTSTVRSSKPLAGGRNAITLSSLANEVARASFVLAAEVGGRWSQELVRFLVQLAKAKVRHEPKVMRGQRSVRLDEAVEVYVGLRRRPSFRPVIVGTSSWSWF